MKENKLSILGLGLRIETSILLIVTYVRTELRHPQFHHHNQLQ